MIDNIKEILHPTDFSEAANNAFAFAKNIAVKKNALLLVMHAVKLPYNYGVEKMMDDLINKNKVENLNIDTTIESGNAIPTILESPADLIVMGTKGRSNMESILFGSISSEVMLKSTEPVLVIPPDQKYSDFKHITFATDFRSGDMKALDQTIELAALYDAAISVLHVVGESDLESNIKFRGFKELVAEKIDYPNLDFELLTEQDFFDGISSFLKKQKTDLIVMTRYKKSFFKNLLDTNHIQKAGYVKVPLLVFPGEKANELEN